RWWRAEDCGIAIPVMILNGRRIEQRTQIIQEGGPEWLLEDQRHNGFDPVIIDGLDPAAFAWAILMAEDRLEAFAADPQRRYPAPLTYMISETENVLGFPDAGTHAAHHLPLVSNPDRDGLAREMFSSSARALHVPLQEPQQAVATLANHDSQNRPLESRNPLVHREPA